MFNGIKAAIAKAVTSRPSVIGLGQLNSPKRGTKELLQLYSQSPWLRAVTHKIGLGVAGIRWRLFVARNGSGKAISHKKLQFLQSDLRSAYIKRDVEAGKVTEIEDHPLLDLLHNGNEDLIGFNVFQVTQNHIDLAGEALWIIERNGLGTPIAMWPIPPDWIKRFPSRSTPFWTIMPGTGTGGLLKVPVTEAVFFRDPDPANPYGRGSGTGQSLGDEIEIDEFSAKHQKNFFYNRARPDIIISGDNLSQADAKRLEQQWLEKHRGFWNCHDDKTEILTKNGWKLGIDLTKRDCVATWNDDNQTLEYQNPTHLHSYEYNGLLHHWKSKALDAMVTPNHRMWMSIDSKNWMFKESKELMSNSTVYFRVAGGFEGNNSVVEIPSVSWCGRGCPSKGMNDPLMFFADDFADVLGFMISEGFIEPTRVFVNQVGQNEYKKQIVNKINASFSIFEDVYVKRSLRDGNIYEWLLTHKGFATWAVKHIGCKARDKHIPKEVFDWPIDAKKRLLNALVLGDGQWRKGKENSATYWTVSKQLANDVQRLSIEVGWRSYLKYEIGNTPKGKLWHYRIGINKTFRTVLQRDVTSWVKQEPYKGTVWCATVPNGTLVTRRNGKVLISGNSFKPLFFSRKIDIKEVSQSFEAMQMTQLRKHERDTFISVFGIPPEKIGVVSDSKRCHDDKTECLTNQGWKFHQDLTLKDKVATWNNDKQCLEYHFPLAIHRYHHDGIMHHWLNQTYDCMVTPNHEMFIKRHVWKKIKSENLISNISSSNIYFRGTGGRYGGDISVVQIPHLPNKRGFRSITPNGTYSIEGSYAKQLECDAKQYWEYKPIHFARFLGYWIAEGYVSNRTNPDFKDFGIRICQLQGLLSNKIKDSLTYLGVGMVSTSVDNRPHRSLPLDTHRISSKSIWYWLKDNVGFGAENKRLPKEVFGWPIDAKFELLNALIDGDGHWTIPHIYRDCWFSSSSKDLAEDIQRLCIEIGLRARTWIHIDTRTDIIRKPQYGITISEKETYCLQYQTCKEITYTGTVWCATVPNGLFVTRRNGIVSIHSNSTIAAADLFWNKDVIKPRVSLLRMTLQHKLVPMFDARLILDFDTPVIQDDEFNLKTMEAAKHAYTINEWRELTGKEGLGKFGDQILMPLNSELVDVKSGESSSPDEPDDGPDDNDDDNEDEDDKSVLANIISKYLEYNLPNLKKMLIKNIHKNRANKEYDI